MAYLSQSGHQNPNAGGTDDQQFSLNTASNVVTFTLEDGGTPQTLDLTPYLPDGTGTDDQRISQFGVIGTNLVISIEDGNTVSLPLSSLPDNDQQTISLAGSTLSIFNGNSVNLASINTDNQILTTTVDADGNTDSVTISGGNTVPIQHAPPLPDQTLTLTTEEKLVPVGFANINANGSIASSFGSPSVTRIATGRYQAVPPTGALTVQLTVVEDFATRDSITVRAEDFTTTWHITEGDNGTGANTPRDQPHMAVWYGLEDDLVDVTIS